jgi:hypothetical protein
MNPGKFIVSVVVTSFCLLLFTKCIIAVPNGCSKQTVSGSGEIVTRTRVVPEFKRVFLKGSGHVTLVRREAQNVEIKTDKNIMPLIKTEVKGDLLEISHENVNLKPTTLEFHLGMKLLKGVTISGSGDVTGRSAFAADEFKAEINGSGDLDLAIVASRLATVINGSGSIVLSGKTTDYQATINGSGVIRALNLDSKRASVTITGSGDCSLCASESLTAFISGSGDVIYTGSPRVEGRVKGSGSVKARR